jgi:hypothetical protein
MLVWCGWCSKLMYEKPPYELNDDTHGICSQCEQKIEVQTGGYSIEFKRETYKHKPRRWRTKEVK